MKKKAYIIPETIVVKMETVHMIAFSDANSSSKDPEDPYVDPNPDNTDEPIRSRGYWDDEEDDF